MFGNDDKLVSHKPSVLSVNIPFDLQFTFKTGLSKRKKQTERKAASHRWVFKHMVCVDNLPKCTISVLFVRHRGVCVFLPSAFISLTFPFRQSPL